MGTMAKQLEENLEKMNIDEEDSEDDNLPVFTPELARLKKLEAGEHVSDDEGSDDAEMDGENDGGKAADKYPEAFSDSEEEKDDFTIRKTDSIIVAATAENDHSNLEVYIYEHDTANLYVHHEIILSSYPLCMQWLPSWQGQKANMMIVGTFIPEIEIWNLDSENCDPIAVLGCAEDPENSKLVTKYKKHEKKSGISETTHTDAIMSLSLNPFQREYLASGSADKTVKIWDVEELAAKATYASLHDDKVQVVRWSNKNESILLTGGYDGKLNVVDVRDENATMTYQLDKAWKDIESADWHATSETNFVVTTEVGMLLGFDTRYFKAPIF
jgi:periodic tryptophan protein 1